MNFVRWILGKLVLGYDALTRPKQVTRDAAAQAKMDAKTKKFALYQFNACPFCVKVRRELHRHALNVELRDARNDEAHKQALVDDGGRYKVPYLHIENDSGEPTWLYESDDIIAYLKNDLKLA